MSCSICIFADKHHWWGPEMQPGATHCQVCHRSWTGKLEIHCLMCCEHFSRPEVLDMHKTAKSLCLDPASVKKQSGLPALRKVLRGSGWVWLVADERVRSFQESPAKTFRLVPA